MTTVDIEINGQLDSNHNDPSDAWDYLISKGCPKHLFIQTPPDKGYSWQNLPYWFVHNMEVYHIRKSDDIVKEEKL